MFIFAFGIYTVTPRQSKIEQAHLFCSRLLLNSASPHILVRLGNEN